MGNAARSRTARKSRRKGNQFELEIAKALAEALGVPKNECCRTPNSGALIERSDLRFSDRVRKVFPWYVEAKKREGWTLDGYFNPKWEIWKWYEDAEWKARKDHTSGFQGVKADPLLVFSKNFMQPLVMVRLDHYNQHLKDKRPKFRLKLLRNRMIYVVFRFKAFLRYVEKVDAA